MPRRPTNSVDRFLAGIRNNKLVTLVITVGVGVIALANFTDALTKLGNFIGFHVGKEIDATDAKTKIRLSIRDIGQMSPGDAQRALTVVEGVVASANTSEVKQAALTELVTFISNPTAPSTRVRSIRKMVMDSIIRINGRDLAALFGGDQLQDADLYGMDLSRTSLRGVNLEKAFAAETNFENANLDGADFYNAFLRNAKFAGASVIGTDFDGADWFNSSGFTVFQLQSAERKTLMSCPATDIEMKAYLKGTYDYSFDEWGIKIQAELRANWKTYWAPDGLAAAVARWRSE
jgi:hypothetical protein